MHDDSAMSASMVLPEARSAVAGRNIFRRFYDRWLRAAHAVGIVQTRVIMLAIYLAVVVPTGALMRLFRDPMHLRHPDAGNWSPVRQNPRTVDAARQQF